jgi:hypothetical protein
MEAMMAITSGKHLVRHADGHHTRRREKKTLVQIQIGTTAKCQTTECRTTKCQTTERRML